LCRAEVAVDDASFERCEGLMERLLELDDVDNVYTNCEGLAN
jgi:transcriptional/translational regulatory protein YebC/TACO1